MIDEFAFCFLSSNIEDVLRQENEVSKLSDKFQIERWYRHDRNVSQYMSFSQMINDAIDDTDSEFMIFCNPKTNFTAEDIEKIIDKLSNGYCFVSVVSFGFFGMSKELIRHIGMLDERFIGGEFEDDDFSIRLLNFGRAVWWEYDFTKYNLKHSHSHNLKFLSHSFFKQKYTINDYEIIIDKNFFKHKKISKRHRKKNKNIYDTWMDYSKSNGYQKFVDSIKNKKIKFSENSKKQKLVKFNFNLEKNKSNYKFELLSNDKIELTVVLLKNFNQNREPIHTIHLKNNMWHLLDLSYIEESIEIRIFIDDNQIFNTTLIEEDNLNLNFNLPVYI